MKLSIEDLGTVYEDVYKVRSQWYKLGLQLRVPPDTLDSIKSERLDPGESLHEALKVWLKRVNPWPTWSTMIEALRSPTVGELQLAAHLEKKYCDDGHTDETQSQAGILINRRRKKQRRKKQQPSRRKKQPMCSMLSTSLFIVIAVALPLTVYIFQSVPVVKLHVHSELEVLSLKNYSDSLAPNNLPVLYGPFLGRDRDLNEISHLLIHSALSGITMVNIHGTPAVGKSTLAIHIGYALAAHGIAIRYIPVQDAHYLLSNPDDSSPHSHTVTKESKTAAGNSSELRVLAYSDIVVSWYSQSEHHYVPASAQHLLEWAMGLKNSTLLILDNCDRFLQSEKHKKLFKQALKDLHQASKYLRIVSTSRMQFTILDGFKPWKLNSLDNSSAIELLQYESNSILTASSSREIAKIVGNNPLALKIAAHLFREINILKPWEVLDELKSNPMKTLSPSENAESEQILPLLHLSYKYLNPITKTCAHYLSNFPGSFSTDAGVKVLSMLNISDPESCMMNLFSRSLLEVYQHAGVPRCEFHTLIKEFLNHVQQDSHYTQTLEKFSWSYQVYYSQVLANVSQFQPENAIKLMENDIHNIQELFEMLIKGQLTEDSIARVGESLCRGILSKVFSEIELLRHFKKVLDQNVKILSCELFSGLLLYVPADKTDNGRECNFGSVKEDFYNLLLELYLKHGIVCSSSGSDVEWLHYDMDMQKNFLYIIYQSRLDDARVRGATEWEHAITSIYTPKFLFEKILAAVANSLVRLFV